MIGTKSFSTELRDDVTIVRFVDTSYFDTDKYAQLLQELAEFVAREQPRRLLVDLREIQYCSTAFISALLAAQNSLQAWAGTMKLFGLSQVVLETLHHLKLAGSVLFVYRDEQTAPPLRPDPLARRQDRLHRRRGRSAGAGDVGDAAHPGRAAPAELTPA